MCDLSASMTRGLVCCDLPHKTISAAHRLESLVSPLTICQTRNFPQYPSCVRCGPLAGMSREGGIPDTRSQGNSVNRLWTFFSPTLSFETAIPSAPPSSPPFLPFFLSPPASLLPTPPPSNPSQTPSHIHTTASPRVLLPHLTLKTPFPRPPRTQLRSRTRVCVGGRR
jgi:hypothetical protein